MDAMTLRAPAMGPLGMRAFGQTVRGPAFPPGAAILCLFDEFGKGGGQILHDYSGNGNHGLLGNSTTPNTNTPTWTTTGALFDGIDDFITLPASLAATLDGKTGCTLIWVGSRGASGTRHQIVDIPNESNTKLDLSYLATDVIRAGARSKSADTYQSTSTTSTYTNTDYRMIASVTDLSAATVAIYVNSGAPVIGTGKTFGQTTFAVGSPLAYNIDLGRVTTANYYKGTMSMFALYPRVLSTAEIAQAYAYLKSYLAPRGVALA